MKKIALYLIFLLFGFCGVSGAENVYFDWPIAVDGFNPYSFTSTSYPNGRSLGTASHSGEDINLITGTTISSIGDGLGVKYQKNGGCTTPYCGYGALYAVVQYSLDREVGIKIPFGHQTYTISKDFTFVYGHIFNEQYPGVPNTPTTGIQILDGENRTINFGRGSTIGWVAPHTTDGASDDLNGDGAEHLHIGCAPSLVTHLYGYAEDTGYCPAHMVIAASRIGVFEADSTHTEPYWNGGDSGKSQAFSNVWWEKNADGTYKFMDLNNYHNKLGRPNNNHQNAPNEGTDFVHLWESSTDSDYSVYAQDMLQPYEGHSRFGDDGKSIIILNDLDTPYKAYALTEGFYGYYKENDGPYTLGMPFTNDIVRSYANGPHILSGDPIQAGDSVTVRKFKRVYRTSGGDLIYNNERKTLIWKDGISVQEFGVGEFYIDPETCSGVCPQVADQMYVTVDSNPANDIAWPMAGVTVPTGIWFTKPGTYNFVLHNTDGSRKTGWQMTAVITEGNQQSGGGNGGYVYNRSTICQTVTNGAPLGKSYSFYPEDNYVGIWFELNDVYESLNIGWKWYKPNGDLYGECEHITDLPTSSFNSFKAWRFFDVSGMTDLGTWRVELHINGTKVDTQYFSLTEYSSGGSTPPPDPPVLQAPTNLRIIVQ